MTNKLIISLKFTFLKGEFRILFILHYYIFFEMTIDNFEGCIHIISITDEKAYFILCDLHNDNQ